MAIASVMHLMHRTIRYSHWLFAVLCMHLSFFASTVNSFFALPRLAKLCFRSFRLAFVLSVSRITRDHGNGHRPNIVGMGSHLEVINF